MPSPPRPPTAAARVRSRLFRERGVELAPELVRFRPSRVVFEVFLAEGAAAQAGHVSWRRRDPARAVTHPEAVSLRFLVLVHFVRAHAVPARADLRLHGGICMGANERFARRFAESPDWPARDPSGNHFRRTLGLFSDQRSDGRSATLASLASLRPAHFSPHTPAGLPDGVSPATLLRPQTGPREGLSHLQVS